MKIPKPTGDVSLSSQAQEVGAEVARQIETHIAKQPSLLQNVSRYEIAVGAEYSYPESQQGLSVGGFFSYRQNLSSDSYLYTGNAGLVAFINQQLPPGLELVGFKEGETHQVRDDIDSATVFAEVRRASEK